jgi:dolichol-phosphate mannosyltransferase
MSSTTAQTERLATPPPSADDRDVATALVGVTLVVPMYNERECTELLFDSLERIQNSLADRYDLEILLVDDGSSDDTVEQLQAAIATRSSYRVIQHERNRGIAAAIQTGIRAARHEIVVSTDCDGSYDAMLIGEMIPLLEAGADLVTASPYHPLGRVENVPEWRLALSRTASRLYAAACRRKLSCYTSCFRVYRRGAVADIELENERFVGVAELLCKVLDRGGSVVEHPALLRSRVAGQSKMRVVRAACGHLRLIGKIALLRLITGKTK